LCGLSEEEVNMKKTNGGGIKRRHAGIPRGLKRTPQGRPMK